MIPFSELRKKYPLFVYDTFSYELVSDDTLTIQFSFKLPPDITFNPVLSITGKGRTISLPDKDILDQLIFNIGLVELLSYWKAACSPTIEIRPMPVSNATRRFWLELFYNGMGEYFYKNKIDYKNDEFVSLKTEVPTAAEILPQKITTVRQEPLLMLSGGKDSCVSANILNQMRQPYSGLLINPLPAAFRVFEQNNCQSLIEVHRKIDPKLIELNDQGYLNGHTPFSALLGILGVTSAALFGFSHVLVSNETSSNAANVFYLGDQINHEYSKSFKFESLFNDYVKLNLVANIDYLSLIRPINEMQVCFLFAQKKENWPIFRSCNKNQAQDNWCGTCAKCVSLYTIFYPFIPEKELIGIFKKNVLADENNEEMLLRLIGKTEARPFECVPTTNEILAAILLGIRKKHSEKPPVLLKKMYDMISKEVQNPDDVILSCLTNWDDDHFLPDKWCLQLRQSVAQVIKNVI